MSLTVFHVLGFVLCVLAIAAIGLWSGRGVTSASDFSVGGGKGSLLLITGLLLGTNIGGGATIGTAQSAFLGGFYGIWWCLGLSLGGLMIAIFFSGPMKCSGCTTLQQLLRRRYGARAALLSAILSSLGVLISIVTQQLSAIALLTAFFHIDTWVASLISAALMACYVLFGGALSAGLVGLCKAGLLFALSLTSAGAAAWYLHTQPGALLSLPSEQYFSLHTGGLASNLGNAVATAVGLTCSQVYFQAFATARDQRTGQVAAALSSLLLIPVSISSILVGLCMRIQQPDLAPSLAFPSFLIHHFPPLWSGIAIAALLITIVGSGAGVALSISTVITTDLFGCIAPHASDRLRLAVSRWSIAAVMALTWLFAATNLGSLVLEWSFLSMAFRSAVNCAPLYAALFFRRHVSQRCCLASMLTGIAVYLIGQITQPDILEPLFLSLPLSLAVLLFGYQKHVPSSPTLSIK